MFRSGWAAALPIVTGVAGVAASLLLAQPDPATVAVAAALGDLTAREREITTMVGAGLSNTEIADRLTISPATAKTHINRAMMKTGARDRAQLVVFAYENGLVRTRARD